MKKSYLVLVDEAEETSVSTVRLALEEVGFVVQDCIPELGTIVGSIEETEVTRVQNVFGIMSVTEEGYVGIMRGKD